MKIKVKRKLEMVDASISERNGSININNDGENVLHKNESMSVLEKNNANENTKFNSLNQLRIKNIHRSYYRSNKHEFNSK